jgi:uncharacterized membrane protein
VHSSDSRPFLLIGIILVFLGVASTLMGQSLSGRGRTADRSTNPAEFWRNVTACYLVGLCFIGFFLYEVYWLPK